MKPDFLYIGAPRSGSTWLYRNLQQHPDIWIPPCKSVLYFHPRFQIYRLKKFRYFWKEALFKGRRDTRKWYRYYFTSPLPGDRWYQNLFPKNRISGEIAEAYCSLEEEQVRRVHNMMPDVKIIFVMRNPFERALSHAKLGLVTRKKRLMEDVAAEEFLWHINHPSSEARTRYSQTLDLWQSYFKKEQFLICFYEDLCTDQEKFLSDICTFLGAGYERRHFEDTLYMTVNPSVNDDLPRSVIEHTARKYQDEIKTISQRYGGPAQAWEQQIVGILKRAA